MQNSLFPDEEAILDESAVVSPQPQGHLVWDFPEEYIVLDTETTGLDPLSDEMIEFAGIKFHQDQEIGRLQILIKPKRKLDPFITHLTGISSADLADAPVASEALPIVQNFLGSSLLVAHNAIFDISFLAANYAYHLHRPLLNNYSCTLKLSQAMFPEMSSFKLSFLASRLAIEAAPHRALADTLTTAELLRKLKAILQEHQDPEQFLYWQRSPQLPVPTTAIIPLRDDIAVSHPLWGKRIVLLGNLMKLSRREAKQALANVGAINQDLIDEHTDFLVQGSRSGNLGLDLLLEEKNRQVVRGLSLPAHQPQVLLETEFIRLLRDERH